MKFVSLLKIFKKDMSFTFVHRPKPKKFGYKPVFYKNEEEDPDDRKLRLKSSIKKEELDLKSKIHNSWARERKHGVVSKDNILKTLIVLILLILIIFFVKIG